MIQVTETIFIDDAELSFAYIRAGGPGGQNVNKVSTAVQMRFDAAHSPNIPNGVRARLRVLAGQRWTKDGEIVIEASKYRTQAQNRDDAIARLTGLIQQAAKPIKHRRPTKPTRGSKERRLDGKKKRADVKRGRRGDW